MQGSCRQDSKGEAVQPVMVMVRAVVTERSMGTMELSLQLVILGAVSSFKEPILGPVAS